MLIVTVQEVVVK